MTSLHDDIYKMPRDKEKKAQYDREYSRARYKTPAGRKRSRIDAWKRIGIICDDWDALHERFMTTTHCEKCSVLLTAGCGRTGKCVDHDHDIKDRENVRAVLCMACNVNDMCTNTSGVPNVNYHKNKDRWRYTKMVNGVIHERYFKTKKEAICYKYEYET